MADSLPENEAQRTLRKLRLLWGLSLAGQFAILAVAAWLRGTGRFAGDADAGRVLAFIAVAMFGIVTPAAYFTRNQFYKRWWQGDRITPRGYFTGNVALFAMVESVTLVAAAALLFGGLGTPAIYIALLALLVFLLNFPTGAPMRPTPPSLGERRP